MNNLLDSNISNWLTLLKKLFFKKKKKCRLGEKETNSGMEIWKINMVDRGYWICAILSY